jgi:predicted DNA-binding transcriptional regulator AlpA
MKAETIKTAAALLTAGIPDKAEQSELLAMLNARGARKEKMLTTGAACKLAGVCPKTLFRWEVKGYLHPKRITPSRVRWPQSELENFLCETA